MKETNSDGNACIGYLISSDFYQSIMRELLILKPILDNLKKDKNLR